MLNEVRSDELQNRRKTQRSTIWVVPMTSSKRQAAEQGDLPIGPITTPVSVPVECLGLAFESDQALRAHFIERPREKLEDPEFRKTRGFPKGDVEDILAVSDPPYLAACPNPFLIEFVALNGKPCDPSESYSREPFAVDVSVGKTDQIYRARSYHEIARKIRDKIPQEDEKLLMYYGVASTRLAEDRPGE